MILPVTPSIQQQQHTISKLSFLNRICKDAHLHPNVINTTLFATGIILMLSGILLLVFSLTATTITLTISLGAIILGLGAAFLTIGVVSRVFRFPSKEYDEILAKELVKVQKLAEEKTIQLNQVEDELAQAQQSLSQGNQEMAALLEEQKEWKSRYESALTAERTLSITVDCLKQQIEQQQSESRRREEALYQDLDRAVQAQRKSLEDLTAHYEELLKNK